MGRLAWARERAAVGCRYDAGWTQLLVDGPDEHSRLFLDWFLIRLGAAEMSKAFAHEGLYLCMPSQADALFACGAIGLYGGRACV